MTSRQCHAVLKKCLFIFRLKIISNQFRLRWPLYGRECGTKCAQRALVWLTYPIFLLKILDPTCRAREAHHLNNYIGHCWSRFYPITFAIQHQFDSSIVFIILDSCLAAQSSTLRALCCQSYASWNLVMWRYNTPFHTSQRVHSRTQCHKREEYTCP